jgi:hypothetical protein
VRDSTGRRLAWRQLESQPQQENLIDDANATGFGQWKRIDNVDVILTLYDEGANRQVALYALDGTPAFEVITSGTGTRLGPALWLDPATGRYTLVVLRDVGGQPPSNVAEIWQRNPQTLNWVKLYEFDAADVGETDSELVWLQSMEPFIYQGVSYLVFQTSSSNNFLAEQVSHVRIMRVDEESPTYFKRVSQIEEGEERKRTESEVHHPTNDSPAIFYTQEAVGQDDGGAGCSAGDNMLRRARTGVPAN